MERYEGIQPTGVLESPRRTMIEFFAGIGLVNEALRPFGWSALLANDNDVKKIAAYRLNYPEVNIDCGCISGLDIANIRNATLATASFPCVDLSQAGFREGIHGPESGFVWEFFRKIDHMRFCGNAPTYLLIENVPNLLSIREGAAIDALLHEVARLGYAFDLVQVDAQHFVPQSRNRVFLIAVDRTKVDSDNSYFPLGSHIRRYKVKQAVERNQRLPWYFFDFPDLPQRQLQLSDIIEPLPQNDKRWWDSAEIAYFWDIVEDEHRVRLKSMIEAGIDGTFTAVRRLRRRRKREQIFNVRFDGLASCLRTPKGGSSTQYVIEVSRSGLRGRRLLGIEAARLQGVCLPDSAPGFQLYGSETDVRYAFGDAVCVPAMRWVVEHSIEALISQAEASVSIIPTTSKRNQLEFSLA